MFSSPNIAKISVSRRRALGLAGLALAAPSVAVARETAPPTAAQDLQGAGFYRWMSGQTELAVVSDGTFPFAPPFPTFGANVGEEKVKAALERDFIRYDRAIGHVNTLLIRRGGEVILVDTGCGTLFGPTTGKLIPRLAKLGVTPADVTAVVLTHLHPDHIGGLVGPGAVEAFSKAAFFLHKDEEAFWSADAPDMSKSGVPEEARAGMIQAAKAVLSGIARRRTLLGDTMAIADGVTAFAAPGHTPGHIGVIVGTEPDRLFYIADAVHHHAIVMPNPEFHVAFDTDRDAAAKQRRTVLDRAASERVLVSGAHLPFPAVGHVRKSGDGFEWVPAVWEWPEA